MSGIWHTRETVTNFRQDTKQCSAFSRLPSLNIFTLATASLYSENMSFSSLSPSHSYKWTVLFLCSASIRLPSLKTHVLTTQLLCKCALSLLHFQLRNSHTHTVLSQISSTFWLPSLDVFTLTTSTVCPCSSSLFIFFSCSFHKRAVLFQRSETIQSPSLYAHMLLHDSYVRIVLQELIRHQSCKKRTEWQLQCPRQLAYSFCQMRLPKVAGSQKKLLHILPFIHSWPKISTWSCCSVCGCKLKQDRRPLLHKANSLLQ